MRAYVVSAALAALLAAGAMTPANASLTQKAAPAAAAKGPVLHPAARGILASLNAEIRRIDADTKRGKLTAAEEKTVKAQEASIRDEVMKMAGANHGKLTAKQVHSLRGEIASLSKEIHKLATNSTRA